MDIYTVWESEAGENRNKRIVMIELIIREFKKKRKKEREKKETIKKTGSGTTESSVY
jgi:hypothetical protein